MLLSSYAPLDLRLSDFSTFDSFYLFFYLGSFTFCLGSFKMFLLSFSFCLLSFKVTFVFTTFDLPTKKDTLEYLLRYKKHIK